MKTKFKYRPMDAQELLYELVRSQQQQNEVLLLIYQQLERIANR